MNIREISKPITAKGLNENLAKKFGTKINIDAFTLEQLQDARNRLRTKLSQVETNESFDAIHTSNTYQQSKLFLDVLNAAILERENIAEAEKTPSTWTDKSGKTHPATKVKGDRYTGKEAEKDEKKKDTKESVIREGEEDKAELVMAAKDMVDRLTGWMEDTAEMQTESMLDLADAIRDELGQEQSDAFVNSVKPALESLYAAMETTRTALTQGVGQLTGEAAPAEPMGADTGEEPLPDMGEPGEGDDMEPPVDAEDDFAAAAPAAGGEEEAGRAKRESKDYSAKKAAAGKDIGKPGKNFSKIAKSAGEKYGSKERGEKVAGAVLKKLRASESTDSRRLATLLSSKKK